MLWTEAPGPGAGRGAVKGGQPLRPQNGLPMPLAAPTPAPTLHRPPAHVTRPAPPAHRAGDPGSGSLRRWPRPSRETDQPRKGKAGRVVTANGGGAQEGSNRLVGGGERRRERRGT